MSKPHQFNRQDIELIDAEPLFQGYFKMTKFHFRHKLFNGGTSDIVQREVFERGHAAGVLPYDPASGEFVLIEQIRIGALETSDTPWLIEIVAGIIDEGETAESVCYREAEEEAGVKVESIVKALSYLASPGGTTERMDIYIGKVDATAAAGVHGLDCENEDILVHRVPEETAMQWLEEGKIDNAAAIIALQWFALNKQKVLDDWSGN